MKISQAISSTLLVAITEALQASEYSEYHIVKFPDGWEAQTLSALDQEFRKALSKAFEGSNLQTFIRDQLHIIRLENGVDLPNAGSKLTEISCFSDPLAVSRRIVKNLERIPLQYRIIVQVTFELAERLNKSEIEISLSDRLRIISGDKIPQTFLIKHKNDKINRYIRRPISGETDISINKSALYLEYRTSGYLATRRNSRAMNDFYDEVRAFYGACVAVGILTEFSRWDETFVPVVVANSIIDGSEEFAYIERADNDIIECANLTTSGKTDKKIKDLKNIDEILSPITSVFKSDNHVKLKTACSWLLRAHLSLKGLDKILESAITIEVLMGDRDTSDRIGLSKLMANRCAYALGTSNSKRVEMIEFFAKFYKVRSEVVHSGRTALDPDERRIVDEGLELATKILRHEIDIAG